MPAQPLEKELECGIFHHRRITIHICIVHRGSPRVKSTRQRRIRLSSGTRLLEIRQAEMATEPFEDTRCTVDVGRISPQTVAVFGIDHQYAFDSRLAQCMVELLRLCRWRVLVE